MLILETHNEKTHSLIEINHSKEKIKDSTIVNKYQTHVPKNEVKFY